MISLVICGRFHSIRLPSLADCDEEGMAVCRPAPASYSEPIVAPAPMKRLLGHLVSFPVAAGSKLPRSAV